VIWPFLAKFGGIRGLVGVSILLLPVTAISLLILTLHGATREQGVWMNSFVQFVFFALGALLAAVLKRRTPEISVLGRVALFLAGVATWLLATYSCGISDVGPAHSAALQIAGYGMVGVGCVCIPLSVLGTPNGMWPRWAVYWARSRTGYMCFIS
jgi:cytochrome c oxidase assembly factor CtaG